MCALNRVLSWSAFSVRRNSRVCTSPGRAVILSEVSVAVKLTAATGDVRREDECARDDDARICA